MSSLKGKTLVFTGTLNTPRSKASAMATAAGAKVTSAVSGNTDILVAGAQAGSKLATAKAKGIFVMTEDEFVAAASSSNSATNSGGGGKTSKKTSDSGTSSATTLPTAAGGSRISWEWYDDANKAWKPYVKEDSAMIEVKFFAGKLDFTVTSELSFNTAYKTPYAFDLKKRPPTQTNTESKTVKKLRRLVKGKESYGDEAAAQRGKRGREDEDEEEEEEDKPKVKAAPVAKKKAATGVSVLNGKTIVFTGTLSIKRNLATAKATNAGAKVTGSVSKKTDYLVCGEDAGSKEEQAESLGVKIISEKKFLKMCEPPEQESDDDGDDNPTGLSANDLERIEKGWEIEFVFMDHTNDNPEDDEFEYECAPDTKMRLLLDDAAENFGFESGGSVNAESMARKGKIVPRNMRAGQMMKKYGKRFLLVERPEYYEEGFEEEEESDDDDDE